MRKSSALSQKLAPVGRTSSRSEGTKTLSVLEEGAFGSGAWGYWNKDAASRARRIMSPRPGIPDYFAEDGKRIHDACNWPTALYVSLNTLEDEIKGSVQKGNQLAEAIGGGESILFFPVNFGNFMIFGGKMLGRVVAACRRLVADFHVKAKVSWDREIIHSLIWLDSFVTGTVMSLLARVPKFARGCC